MSTRSPVRRRPRGEQRRDKLLRAALRLIALRGIGSVTHRAVAEAAEVPTPTTSYYFSSIGELLEEALALFVQEETERLKLLAAQLERLGTASMSLGAMAELFAAELVRGHEDGGTIAQFELYLEASRRPRLRERAAACLDAYADVAAAALRAAGAQRVDEGARLFVALIDGLALAQQAVPQPHWERDVLLPAMREFFVVFAMTPEERADWDVRLEAPS